MERTAKQIRGEIERAEKLITEARDVIESVNDELDQEAADGGQHPVRAKLFEQTTQMMFDLRDA